MYWRRRAVALAVLAAVVVADRSRWSRAAATTTPRPTAAAGPPRSARRRCSSSCARRRPTPRPWSTPRSRGSEFNLKGITPPARAADRLEPEPEREHAVPGQAAEPQLARPAAQRLLRHRRHRRPGPGPGHLARLDRQQPVRQSLHLRPRPRRLQALDRQGHRFAGSSSWPGSRGRPECEGLLSKQQRKTFRDSLQTHGTFLADPLSYHDTNHGLYANRGLYLLGRMVPSLPESPQWRQLAIARFKRTLRRPSRRGRGVLARALGRLPAGAQPPGRRLHRDRRRRATRS